MKRKEREQDFETKLNKRNKVSQSKSSEQNELDATILLDPDPLDTIHSAATLTNPMPLQNIEISFDNDFIKLPLYVPRDFRIKDASSLAESEGEWQQWHQHVLSNILTAPQQREERNVYQKEHPQFLFFQLYLESKKFPGLYTVVFVKSHKEYDTTLQLVPHVMSFYQKAFYNEKLIYQILINRFLEEKVSPHFVYMYKDYVVKYGPRRQRKAFMLFEKGGFHHHMQWTKQPYRKEMIQSKSLNLHSFFKHYNASNTHDNLILNVICSNQFLFQLIYSLYCMQQCGLMHDDLHDGNILLDFFEIPIPEMTYEIKELDLVFRFENVQLIPKIIDFDHGILIDHTIENVERVPKSNILIQSPFTQFAHKLNADGTKDLIRILTYIYWGLISIGNSSYAYADHIFKILASFYNYRPSKTMSKEAKVHYDCTQTKEVYARTLETTWYGEAYFKTRHDHFYFLNHLPTIERDGKIFHIRPIQYQNMEDILNLFHRDPQSLTFKMFWNGMVLGKDYFITTTATTDNIIMYSTKSIRLIQNAIVEFFEQEEDEKVK
jgi:hypothetical protein